MADVFISYSREDRARAEQVANGLAGQGLAAFWDTDIPPGQTWADYIEGKLTQCKAVVVLWSEHSTKSQWVREEARMGRDKAKLIPVRLDGSAPPFGFGEVQAADLSTWRGEPGHAEWVRFSAAVRNAVGAPAADPPPAQSQPQVQSGWRADPPPAATQPQSQPMYNAGAAAAAGGLEQLSPVGYVQKCLRLFVNGQGRARRAEFGWFMLFYWGIVVACMLVDLSSGFDPYSGLPADNYLVAGLATLLLLAPSLSVASRRAHDFSQSGWLSVACVIPYVGFIAVLAFVFIPGTPGANQHGPNPKGL